MSNLVQKLEQVLSARAALEDYWNDTLTSGKENPYPLAPPDEVAVGRVTPPRYKLRNTRLRSVSNKVMLPEVAELSQTQSFKDGRRTVVILGWGLGRTESAWLKSAVVMGFQFLIIDVSVVACRKCRDFVRRHELKDSVQVKKVDLEEAWRQGVIDETKVIAYVGSQFIQNQDEEAMGRMMEHFGFFLTWCSDCAVHLLHPLGEDNPPKKVKWRNTTPYPTGRLKLPLCRGFGGEVRVETLRRFRYYRQLYSFLKLSVPRG